MSKRSGIELSSPLDELRIPADRVWEKIDEAEAVTPEDIMKIVEYERAAREAWIAAEEVKLNKKAK